MDAGGGLTQESPRRGSEPDTPPGVPAVVAEYLAEGRAPRNLMVSAEPSDA